VKDAFRFEQILQRFDKPAMPMILLGDLTSGLFIAVRCADWSRIFIARLLHGPFPRAIRCSLWTASGCIRVSVLRASMCIEVRLRGWHWITIRWSRSYPCRYKTDARNEKPLKKWVRNSKRLARSSMALVESGVDTDAFVPARIVWTRFCNSGGLFEGGCLTGFMG